MKTMTPPVLAVLLFTLGCGTENEVTEEDLSPLTEIEIADPIGQSLDYLEELYQARDTGTDPGVVSFNDSGNPEKTDGVAVFIRRMTWTIFGGEGEPTFDEAIDQVVDLIVERTGRPAESVRADVQEALSEDLENTPDRIRPPADDDLTGGSASCTGAPGLYNPRSTIGISWIKRANALVLNANSFHYTRRDARQEVETRLELTESGVVIYDDSKPGQRIACRHQNVNAHVPKDFRINRRATLCAQAFGTLHQASTDDDTENGGPTSSDKKCGIVWPLEGDCPIGPPCETPH